MTKLLFVTSSLFGADSQSRRMAAEFIDTWRNAHPGTAIVERDVASDMPHLTLDMLGALMAPADGRTATQQAAVAFADELTAEVEAADTIVIAAPMIKTISKMMMSSGAPRPNIC